MFAPLYQPHRGHLVGPTSFASSIVIHGILATGLIYATVLAPPPRGRVEELVTFAEIVQPKPEPVEQKAPPPPPPVAATPAQAPPPVARGFQELIPPSAPPAEIKAEDANAQAVDARDYSGVGVAGGRAEGVVGGVPTTAPAEPAADTTPVFTVEETGVTPEVLNRREVQRLLERNYPRQYADAGIAGQVTVKFMIDTDGTVPETSVSVVDASNEAFAEAALKSVSKFKFKPIKYRGERVRVWAVLPITFQPPQ